MGDRDGRWSGRELSLDDDLSGTSGAGWEKLELDPSAVSTSAVNDGLREIGDPFDAIDGGAKSASLELDLRAPPPPERASAPRPPQPIAADELPAAEVAAIADYGAPPAGILGSVPYAVLVLTRRRALQKALAELVRLRRTAERDADEALTVLGRALHAKRGADALAPLASELTAAEESGRVAGQRTEEWQRARDAAEAQRESLRAKIAEAERAAAPYKDRETKLATQMNVRDTDLRRAQARLSRVEIEMRNARAQSSPDEARVQALEAEQRARELEVETAKGHVDTLAPELTEARRDLAVMLAAINDLTQQLRSVDTAQARTESAHSTTTGEAEKRYHDAVKLLAQQAIARSIADAVAPPEAKSAKRHAAALATRDRELRVHEAALRAYDPKAFHRGAALIGGAALLVLITLLLVILR